MLIFLFHQNYAKYFFEIKFIQTLNLLFSETPCIVNPLSNPSLPARLYLYQFIEKPINTNVTKKLKLQYLSLANNFISPKCFEN